MKKYLKKTMSITLAGMMLASTVPAVNAASADTSFAQPCVVDYFNSFNGYVKTAGNNIKEPTPEGFNAHNLDGLNYRHQYLASGTDGANNYLKFTNVSGTHSGMQMKMNETINSGKLHISFDLRIDDLNTFHGFDMRAINAAKNNNVDDWVQADGTTKDTNNVLKLGGDKKIILGTTDKESTTSTVDTYSTSWNKYDLIIDLDSNKMNFYINGTLKDENVTYDQDIKALMFFTSEKSGATTTNMDNLFIKHYPNGELGAPEMVVDYAGTAVPSSNATVYVGFSELTGKSVAKVEKTDFAAVNVVTGEKITPNGAAREAGMVKLTFNTLPAGKYEIKVQDSAAGLYTGEISGKAATVSNTFSVAGAAQNVKEENVLVSDDFENYNGGMPANAVGLYLDKTHTGGTLEKVAGKNGSGMKITTTDRSDDMDRGLAIYKLPYAVTSGKLTYEFDINHTNGMWFTGVLGAECFETDTYSKEVYDQIIAGTATDNAKAIDKVRLRYKTFAVGCKSTNNNTKTNSVTAALGKGFGFNSEISTNSYTSLVDGLTLEPNQWNHVKVEIDLDNAVQTITVGEGESAVTKAFKVYEKRFRPDIRYKQREVAGETKWVKTMTAGVQGISLGAFAGENSAVTYDNLKVYTDNSYIDYSDFNKQLPSTTNTTIDSAANTDNMPPAGWLKQDLNQGTGPNRFYEADGRNKTPDNTDYAIKIVQGDTWSHVLSRPIPANTAFEVSFDVKSVVAEYDSASPKNRVAWTMRLMRKDHIYTTYENTVTGEVPFESVDGKTYGLNASNAANKHTIQSGSAVFGVRTQPDQDGTLEKLYLSGGGGERHYLEQKRHENLSSQTLPEITPADWNHVSLKVEPKNITWNGNVYNKFQFTACLNNDQTFTWTSVDQCVIHNTDEIYALGFNNNGTNTTIDNFKVELIGKTPANIYVTDANAVSIANGEKTALSSGLAASGQKIEVNFSAPVASADAIKVYKYDGTATTAVTAEKSLSTDKKTATLTLDGITEGDKLTLEVPNTVAPATNDGLSRVEATAVAFDVKAAVEPEIKVEEFRLYKKYAGGAYASGKPSEACWAPATESDVANATAADKFKFTAKGYNTGKNENLKFIGAFKDTNLRLRSAIMSDITLENQVGPFAKDTDEFTITERDGFIGAYLWELSTLKPLYKKFNATLPATPGE